MQAFIGMVIMAILNYFLDFFGKKVSDKATEKLASAKDKKASDQAIAEVRKPSAYKTIGEREKDAESKFDKFRNL